MITKVYDTSLNDERNAGIALACELLAQGEAVGLPTETVYGLAADARNVLAVRKIFEAKGRPQDNPLIVHIAEMDMLARLASSVPAKALALAERFWPGPLTMIFPKTGLIPDETSGGLDTVAVRMPSHPVIREIITRSGIPIAAPSANLSGSPSPTTAQHVLNDFNGKIPLILDGGDCSCGVESTVISFLEDTPRLLRPGVVTAEEMSAVIGKIFIDSAITHRLQTGAKALSPGMKYKHYSPRARVILIKGPSERYLGWISENAVKGDLALCFTGESPSIDFLPFGDEKDGGEHARLLFAALRKTDDIGATRLLVHCPGEEGIDLAVYNRLLRAAAFNVIDLR